MDLRIYESILTGFKNYAFPSETVEEMAMVRAKICAGCEHANPKFIFKLFKEGEPLKDIEGLGCNKCGCLISAKVRSPFERCPLETRKW